MAIPGFPNLDSNLQPIDQFPRKWYPILDRNSLIYILYPRVNCLKTIPFAAAHTYIVHIWQHPWSPGMTSTQNWPKIATSSWIAPLHVRTFVLHTCCVDDWNEFMSYDETVGQKLRESGIVPTLIYQFLITQGGLTIIRPGLARLGLRKQTGIISQSTLTLRFIGLKQRPFSDNK